MTLEHFGRQCPVALRHDVVTGRTCKSSFRYLVVRMMNSRVEFPRIELNRASQRSRSAGGGAVCSLQRHRAGVAHSLRQALFMPDPRSSRGQEQML